MMAKRSREDYEPSSPESQTTGETPPTARLIVHPATLDTPAPSSTAKFLHLDLESGEASTHTEMRCSLPPHRSTLTFTSFEEYDVHYAKTHTNRCLECKKNFPTEHFLNLHIEENHDSLVSVRRERGEKTYACFVEDCDRVCSTPQKRRMHLIDKHMFPKDYDFYVINDGIDRRSSMLRSGRHRRRSSAAQYSTEIEERTRRRTSTMETVPATEKGESDAEEEEGKPEALQKSQATPPSPQVDTDMEILTGAMTALKFVPPSVRFGGRGRGRGRGGFSRS